MTVEGVLHIGYNRRSSNEFFPISECPVAAPLLWRAAEALLQLGTKSLDTARWIRDAKEVEFFCTGDENALQLTVFTQNGNTGGFADFCARMKALVPELVGAGISLLPDHSRRQTQLPGPLSEWRADGLIYAAAGEEYWVSRGSFFQVNRFLVDELATLVTRGRKGTTAWDLYAGVGLFSRLLSHSFPQLVAVEASGEDLVKSFKGPGRHAIAATTVEFLRGAIVQRERPQLVVIDPPRAGIGAEVCALLSRIAAKELVYVSCDPVTLARDLKMLIQSGYTIAELHMVDMFPQTFHLETVVVLHKFI
jgi:23S rRNA (uracil1939-C5)-methyltransferase